MLNESKHLKTSMKDFKKYFAEHSRMKALMVAAAMIMSGAIASVTFSASLLVTACVAICAGGAAWVAVSIGEYVNALSKEVLEAVQHVKKATSHIEDVTSDIRPTVAHVNKTLEASTAFVGGLNSQVQALSNKTQGVITEVQDTVHDARAQIEPIAQHSDHLIRQCQTTVATLENETARTLESTTEAMQTTTRTLAHTAQVAGDISRVTGTATAPLRWGGSLLDSVRGAVNAALQGPELSSESDDESQLSSHDSSYDSDSGDDGYVTADEGNDAEVVGPGQSQELSRASSVPLRRSPRGHHMRRQSR